MPSLDGDYDPFLDYPGYRAMAPCMRSCEDAAYYNVLIDSSPRVFANRSRAVIIRAAGVPSQTLIEEYQMFNDAHRRNVRYIWEQTASVLYVGRLLTSQAPSRT